VATLTTALGGSFGPLGYTTVRVLSCATNASAPPLGENATSCTHPAVLFRYSPHTVPNGSLSPHTDASGRSSTFLMKLDSTRAWPSVEPAASSTEFGCQARAVTVERIGFLRCLDTHQLSSSSKWQTAMRRAPEPAANFVSEGDQRTQVAARLMRRRTSVGFQPVGDGSQT
jgi:hypothetical protein